MYEVHSENRSTYTETLQEVVDCTGIILGICEDTFIDTGAFTQDLCIIVLAEHLGVLFIVCWTGYRKPGLNMINEAEMLELH